MRPRSLPTKGDRFRLRPRLPSTYLRAFFLNLILSWSVNKIILYFQNANTILILLTDCPSSLQQTWLRLGSPTLAPRYTAGGDVRSLDNSRWCQEVSLQPSCSCQGKQHSDGLDKSRALLALTHPFVRRE